jgi:hypothetical protein
MNGKDRLNRLHFNDHLMIDQEINSISGVNRDFVIHDRKHFLGFNDCADFLEFITQTLAIWALQQSRTQLGMNTVGSTDNAVSGFAVYKPSYAVVRSRVLRVSAFIARSSPTRLGQTGTLGQKLYRIENVTCEFSRY